MSWKSSCSEVVANLDHRREGNVGRDGTGGAGSGHRGLRWRGRWRRLTPGGGAGRARRGGGMAMGVMAVAAALAGAAGGAAAAEAGGAFAVVRDVAGQTPEGVEVNVLGPAYQGFARLPPGLIDHAILSDFHPSLSAMQDIAASADSMNEFDQLSRPFVAAIPGGRVEGDEGLVYDDSGRVYHEPGHFFERAGSTAPMPGARGALPNEHFDALASTIQKYGHMYYHFVAEGLPKFVMLRNAGLPEGTKVLTYGMPFEAEFLDRLGFDDADLVPYDTDKTYSADVLFMPTPTPRITPPLEALESVREALGVRVLPEEERDLVIYCTREGSTSRDVSNEDEVLKTLAEEFPNNELVVYRGGQSLDDVISLFERAKVIAGPHGAGLTHLLFAAPGTHVLEFLHMKEPPMMFWHMSRALGLDYWMLPIVQSHWMSAEMEVPVDEVRDILETMKGVQGPCPAGEAPIGANGGCEPCQPGSASYIGGTCKPCSAGRYSVNNGSDACRTCEFGTYAEEATKCMTCPAGTVGWAPGANSSEQCLTPEAYHDMMSDTSMNLDVLKKLSPKLSKRAMVDVVELCKERQKLEQNGEGGYTYNLSGIDCDNLGGKSNHDLSADDVAELCKEKEKMESGESYDGYSYDLASLDCGKSTDSDVESQDLDGKPSRPDGGHHGHRPEGDSGGGSGHHGGAEEPQVPPREEPHRPRFPNIFIPDEGCPTGMAVRGSSDTRRREGDTLPLCVECDLKSLAQVVNCSPDSSEEECCEVARNWNNGGCMCGAASSQVSFEMGLTVDKIDQLSQKCHFNIISKFEMNCPRIATSADVKDSGSSTVAPMVAATVGALVAAWFIAI